jgi:transposase, IS30 family
MLDTSTSTLSSAPAERGKSLPMTTIKHKSSLSRLVRSANWTAKRVSEAMIAKLEPLHPHVFAVSNDNGHGFAFHEQVDAALNTKTDYAHPFASRQRGTAEDINGLVRQCSSKSTNFDEVSDA